MPSSNPFAPGDRATLLCAGSQLDYVHARQVGPGSSALGKRDKAAIPTGRSFVVRPYFLGKLPVPGEWFEVEVSRAWQFGSTNYLSGEITRHWLDLDAVNLPLLRLQYEGTWTPEDWLNVTGLEPEDLEPEYAEVLAAGERREVELEQVLPQPFTKLQAEEDGIMESLAWRHAGESEQAEKLLSEMLRQDLRCIDAHAHLGNLYMEGYWGRPNHERALRHYLVGVEIAERSLSPDGTDLTPRGLIDNRPYTRALHGLALAAWALGKLAEAEEYFSLLLLRDPDDGSGARFNLKAVRDGQAFDESEADRSA